MSQLLCRPSLISMLLIEIGSETIKDLLAEMNNIFYISCQFQLPASAAVRRQTCTEATQFSQHRYHDKLTFSSFLNLQ